MIIGALVIIGVIVMALFGRRSRQGWMCKHTLVYNHKCIDCGEKVKDW